MIIKIANGTNSIVGYLVIFILWFISGVVGIYEISQGFFLWDLVPLLKVVVGEIFILITGLALLYFLARHKFIGMSNTLPAIIYMVFCLGISVSEGFMEHQISIFMLLLVSERLVSLHNSNHNYLKVFGIGLLLGGLIVISPSLIGLLFIYLIGLALVTTFGWRDFIIPLFGIGSVVLFFFTIVYLLGLEVVGYNFNFSYPKFIVGFTVHKILLTSISIFEFLFLIKLFAVIEKKNIKSRIHYWIWIWATIFLFISFLFFQEEFEKDKLILFLALPMAIFSIEFFISIKRVFLRELAFVILSVLLMCLRIS
jgi:hypothetical protein